MSFLGLTLWQHAIVGFVLLVAMLLFVALAVAACLEGGRELRVLDADEPDSRDEARYYAVCGYGLLPAERVDGVCVPCLEERAPCPDCRRRPCVCP